MSAPDRLDLIAAPGPALQWSFDELYWVEKPDGGAIHLGIATAPDARLVIEDTAFATALRLAFPDIDRATAHHKGHRRSLIVIGAITAAVAAALYAVVTFLPTLLAPMVPASIQRAIGDAVVRDVVSIFGAGEGKDGRLCDASAGQEALNRLVARMEKGARAVSDRDTPFKVQVANSKMINAMAAPGGRILLFQGLIDFAQTPDELAGVLAHEMAHTVHRHPTVAIIRHIGLVATLDLVLGRGITGGQAIRARRRARRTIPDFR